MEAQTHIDEFKNDDMSDVISSLRLAILLAESEGVVIHSNVVDVDGRRRRLSSLESFISVDLSRVSDHNSVDESDIEVDELDECDALVNELVSDRDRHVIHNGDVLLDTVVHLRMEYITEVIKSLSDKRMIEHITQQHIHTIHIDNDHEVDDGQIIERQVARYFDSGVMEWQLFSLLLTSPIAKYDLKSPQFVCELLKDRGLIYSVNESHSSSAISPLQSLNTLDNASIRDSPSVHDSSSTLDHHPTSYYPSIVIPAGLPLYPQSHHFDPISITELFDVVCHKSISLNTPLPPGLLQRFIVGM